MADQKKYTSPERLVANGSSASAALGAAAIIQRPRLFGAAMIDIPLLDLIRYDKFTGAGFFSPEFGSPANPEEFKALYNYSPYHNLKTGQCYPPTLVKVGSLDQTADSYTDELAFLCRVLKIGNHEKDQAGMQ